eukprot:gene18724-25254_t
MMGSTTSACAQEPAEPQSSKCFDGAPVFKIEIGEDDATLHKCCRAQAEDEAALDRCSRDQGEDDAPDCCLLLSDGVLQSRDQGKDEAALDRCSRDQGKDDATLDRCSIDQGEDEATLHTCSRDQGEDDASDRCLLFSDCVFQRSGRCIVEPM